MALGNIEERSPGVWRIRVSGGVDQVTGKRRVIRRTVKGDRAAAELERARILAERGAGDLGTNATVSVLLDAWLPKARLAQSTRYGYDIVIRKHIRPRLGDYPLHRLTVFVVDQFYQDLYEAGMSPIRIRKVHTVLRAAMRRAVKWRWVTSNPCVDAEPPTVHVKEAIAPDPETVRTLFAEAEKAGTRWFTMLRLAAALGCRRSELCGLQWADIDLKAGTVHVRRAVDVIGGELVIKDYLKNDKRRIPEPIPDDVVRLLREWRVATAAASRADGGDWVFVAPREGGFFRPGTVTTKFRELCNTAGIPKTIKFHGLRHYVGTYMRDAGIDHDVISRRLGHARTSTTIDMYGHAVDGRSREASDVLEQITGYRSTGES